jgi:hypothetical protein
MRQPCWAACRSVSVVARPHVGDVGTPLLVGPRCREVLIEQVRRDRSGVMAVGRPLEPPLLPCPEPVLARQSGYPAAPDCKAAIPQFPRHSGTAIGAVRQGKGRLDMRQQHHVVALAAADQPASRGEIAALANTKHAAQAMDGEFRFCPIDEPEPHRLPSRAKKAVAFFRMSRSWRRISFSRRSKLSARDSTYKISDVIMEGLSKAANGRSQLEDVVERKGGAGSGYSRRNAATDRQRVCSLVHDPEFAADSPVEGEAFEPSVPGMLSPIAPGILPTTREPVGNWASRPEAGYLPPATAKPKCKPANFSEITTA